MVVYFLRHASAGRHLSNPAKDEKRGLDKEGIEQCGYVGRALAALNTQVDAIISSPLKRALQTASLVANEIGYEAKLQTDDALRPESTFNDFRKLMAKYARLETIMVVGHNPNLSEFLGRTIVGGNNSASIDLKKGAVARVDLDRTKGSLQWCITPKVIRAAYASAAESVRPKTSRK